MKKGKIIITGVFLLTIAITGNVNAVLQSRPDGTSVVNKTADQFFTMIRNMEAEGGSLGLKANITNGSYLDTSNNGVDVHMAKNTEWGAAALLAASSYGQAGSGTITFEEEEENGSATTGNQTGIFQMADRTYEYVAGTWNNELKSYNSIIFNADSRYKDIYTARVSKPGDATLETAKWKGASYADSVTSSYPVFRRGIDALFGCRQQWWWRP